MNEHTLSYCSLDFSMKLSEVTFPDSQIATKLSCDKQKGNWLLTEQSCYCEILTTIMSCFPLSMGSDTLDSSNKN